MSSLHHAPFSSKSRFQISTCFCELDSQHSAQINTKYGIIMVHTFKSPWGRHHCLYHHHDQLQNSRVTECLIYCLSLDGWLKWRYSMAQIHLLSNKCVGAIQIHTFLGGEGYYDPNSHHHLQHIATQKNNVQSSSKSFWYTTMHIPRQGSVSGAIHIWEYKLCKFWTQKSITISEISCVGCKLQFFVKLEGFSRNFSWRWAPMKLGVISRKTMRNNAIMQPKMQ